LALDDNSFKRCVFEGTLNFFERYFKIIREELHPHMRRSLGDKTDPVKAVNEETINPGKAQIEQDPKITYVDVMGHCLLIAALLPNRASYH
jgi:hypothetical protein